MWVLHVVLTLQFSLVPIGSLEVYLEQVCLWSLIKKKKKSWHSRLRSLKQNNAEIFLSLSRLQAVYLLLENLRASASEQLARTTRCSRLRCSFTHVSLSLTDLEQNRNCSQSIASGETFGRKLRKYIGHRGKTENLTCPTQVLTQNNSRIIVGCVWHIYIPNVGAMSIIGGNLTPSKLTMPIEKTNFIPWNLDNKSAKGT